MTFPNLYLIWNFSFVFRVWVSIWQAEAGGSLGLYIEILPANHPLPQKKKNSSTETFKILPKYNLLKSLYPTP